MSWVRADSKTFGLRPRLWLVMRFYGGFARQPCCMEGTIDSFSSGKRVLSYAICNIFIVPGMQHGCRAKPLFIIISTEDSSIFFKASPLSFALCYLYCFSMAAFGSPLPSPSPEFSVCYSSVYRFL